MEVIRDTFIQTILVFIIQALVPVVLGYLVVLLRKKIAESTAQLSAEQLAFATELARQFVLSAEQQGLIGAIQNEGAAKKEWALKRLESELDIRGIKINVRMLSDLLESAVHESFNLGTV